MNKLFKRIMGCLLIAVFIFCGTVFVSAEGFTYTASSYDITLKNCTVGYQYSVNTADEAPTATDKWKAAEKATLVFDKLLPDTAYYIYTRENTSAKPVRCGSIQTAPAAILASESLTSFSVKTAGFSHVLISKTEAISDSAVWISTTKADSQMYMFSGSEVCTYSTRPSDGKVVFSQLNRGDIYFVYGKTSDGRESTVAVYATQPDVYATSIEKENSRIKIDYNGNCRYSINGSMFFKPSVEAQRINTSDNELVTLNITGNKVLFSNLNPGTTYEIRVAVYYNNAQLGDTYKINISTTDAKPTDIVVTRQLENELWLVYKPNMIYRIDGGQWTSTFTSYPTKETMLRIGLYYYYFYPDSKNPQMIIFSGLAMGETYTIECKYADDTSLDNIVSKEISTKGCTHTFREKEYGADGLSYTQVCAKCGYVLSGKDSIEDCTHRKTRNSSIPSTCSQAGYSVTICTVCGKEISSRTPLPLLPHTYDNDCDTTCNVCGAERTVYHQYVHETVDPTCSKVGYGQDKCKICGVIKEGSYIEIEKLPHTPGDWVVTHEATPKIDGERVIRCTVCNALIKQEYFTCVEKIVNENGSVTYQVPVAGNMAELSKVSETAAGQGNIRVVFQDMNVTVTLDQIMSALFIQPDSHLSVVKAKPTDKLSGDIVKAGFDVSDPLLAVYEIDTNITMVSSSSALVTIPFIGVEGQNPVVYYVAPDGTTEVMTSEYDAVNHTLTFETTHFSTYVARNETPKVKSPSIIWIIVIAIIAVIIATAATFGYIVYTSKKTNRRKFRI